ncbi:MAG: MFS transporter [Mastigocoleus sp. MO_167.B18]|uniref:MFS transporter n=1 Tax=Mastigocoleus sp. MO_188.B34 TaxID=3036635 RepID=UPI002609C68C|nr:MFS transporter [Mastigocoleus sp. MO_188.B34]MDJ0693133.1 MFS transporter [Mastigocoleus sp. MO_188.B34]MDJ0773028.1 MFS transporter [Mastigocoleus sp. MO_167.B18]
MTQSQNQINNNYTNILWLQVCCLGMVQGAISITWVIYNLYLPKLLVEFGFPKSLAISLLILENALAVVMEPLMGSLSDNMQRWFGSKFPFITAGVLLSSSLLIAIPCLVTFTSPESVIRYILPVLMVAWALAMTVFRSPVLSLLGRYALPKSLPMAVSVLTLIIGIIGAFRLTAYDFILGLGPIATFTTASFVLLASAAILRFVHPPDSISDQPVDRHRAVAPLPVSFPALGLIFTLGASFAWGYRLLLDAVGKFLKVQLSLDNVELQLAIFGIAIAIAALPAGAVATKIGNRKAMLGGSGVTVVLMFLMPFIGAQFIVLALLVGAFIFILNGTLPFALEMVPPHRGGLGVGMYFGGAGLAMSIFGSTFPDPKAIAPEFAAVVSAIAFLIAGVCVAAGNIIDARNSAI